MNKEIIYQQSNKLNKFINHLQEKNLSPKTISIYSEGVRHFKASFGDSVTMTNITDFFREKAQGLGVNTIISRQTALKAYSKFKKLKIEWTRIARLVPKYQRKFFATVNHDELEQLKRTRYEKSLKTYHRNNLILDFLFFSGCRISELANIKHSDWDGTSLRILGKGNKVRHVFLPGWLTRNFSPYRTDYLFITTHGNPVDKDIVGLMIRKRTKQAGINKRITPHTFRRSFATLLDRNGARLTTIQKLLGHSNITTTAQYIHSDYETLYQDYSKLLNSTPSLTTHAQT